MAIGNGHATRVGVLDDHRLVYQTASHIQGLHRYQQYYYKEGFCPVTARSTDGGFLNILFYIEGGILMTVSP